ncbi:permease [Leptospira sp. 'Mane']|uniref:permease n=1 Tax=Leptospira sp. 'Mane' TaxID=3387407 RepID=UPI00398B23C0
MFSKEISKLIHHICRFSIFIFVLSVASLYASPKTSNVLSELKNKQGYWKVTNVVWEESSGPVSPEFHYAKQIQIEANKQGFFLSKKESNKNTEPTETKKKISQNTYVALMKELFHSNALHLSYEEPPKQKVLGISYNSFSIRVGSKQSRFYYVLKDLEKKEFKKKKEIIQIMKRIKL